MYKLQIYHKYIIVLLLTSYFYPCPKLSSPNQKRTIFATMQASEPTKLV